MPSAITLLAPTTVLVSQDLKETDGPAMISMNAKPIRTIVVFMHSAITRLALMTVHVSQDSKEMVCRVKM